MGATVGCEPACITDDFVVVAKKHTASKSTQAPSALSSDNFPHEDDPANYGHHHEPPPDAGHAVRQRQALEALLAQQEEPEAQQALRGAVASSALATAEEPDAFSTLPLESKGVGTEEKAADSPEHLTSAETTGGVAFASQSSGHHTILQEDSPRTGPEFGGTFGHNEALALVSGISLQDGSAAESPMGTMELPKHAAVADAPAAGRGRAEFASDAEQRDPSTDVTIEKEPSIQSGGTIVPDDELEAIRAEALRGPATPSQGSAFSFAAAAVAPELRPPSDELAYAACAARAVGATGLNAGFTAASSSREARAPARAPAPGVEAARGVSAHNPQEGACLSQVVQGMRSSSVAASAARRQAAENRLAQLASHGEPGSLVDAKIKVKEWQWQLKMEMKTLEREIKKVRSDELKLQKQMQAEAQKGNTKHVQQLARSIVRSRRTVRQLESTKVSMNDLSLQLTTCAAAMSMKHAVRVSADAMQGMNGAASMEDLACAVEDLQNERLRGLAVEDALEDAFANEEEEAEANLEVQKLLEEFELDRMGLLAGMGPAPLRTPSSGTLAARHAPMGSGVSP